MSIEEPNFKKSSKQQIGKIKGYLIITAENDNTHVGTTLTIYKDYKFNYLRNATKKK